MFQELKFQLSTAILTILTLAAGVSAFFNFEQQNRFRLAEDGVIWVDRHGSVEALYVKPASPGLNAGIHRTDRLLDIDGVKIEQATDVARVLARIGAWSRAKYRLQSRGVELTATLVVAEQPLDRAVIYQYAVGTAYLIIGLFVYFRRGSAQKARHFYVLCLASFISLCFHYTGQFHIFDQVIYFGNLVAGLDIGKSVPVESYREGKKTSVNVAIESQPANMFAAGGMPEGGEAIAGKLGLEVQTLSKELAQQYGYKTTPKGVVVTQVTPGSSADNEGLKEGMVITQVGDKETDTAEQFQESVSAKEAAAGVRLRVTDPSGGARFVLLSPSK